MQQIIIPTEKHAGELAAITQVLADRKINLLSLDAQECSDQHGWIILTVDQYELAVEILNSHGFKAFSEETLVIAVDDEPGALASIAQRFRHANINVRSLHIVRRVAGSIHVSLVADNQAGARELVNDIIVTND